MEFSPETSKILSALLIDQNLRLLIVRWVEIFAMNMIYLELSIYKSGAVPSEILLRVFQLYSWLTNAST